MAGTLICYGDSNTYGYDPRSPVSGRYGKDIRWTGILESSTDWCVRNHGVNGRCIPHNCSQIHFACSQTEGWQKENRPVWLMIMLGTNDLLQEQKSGADATGRRMEAFLQKLSETAAVRDGNITLWLVSPPVMGPGAWVTEDRICRESEKLGDLYRKIAEKREIKFTDTGKWEIPVLFDGVHFSEEGHRQFAGNILKELPKQTR